MIDEDFQAPLFSNGTSSPAFTNWTITGKSRRNDGSSDVPGENYPTFINQLVQFEYTSQTAIQDLTNTWTTNDVYIIGVYASPQSWNGGEDRYLVPSLRQTDNTVLWSTNVMTPKYDNFGRNDWTELQKFSWVIAASNFSTGTPGQPLRLRIESAGYRGTYIDNVSLILTNSMPPDSTPPTPDPMTWSVEPYSVNFTNITMTATIAVDSPYGVEYYFENTNTAANSGWQGGVTGNTWTEFPIAPNTTNSYRVKARDLSPNQNETAWSDVVAVTSAAPDVTPPTPDPMTWSTDPMVVDSLNIYMVASTATDPYLGVEYFFTNTVTGATSGWQSSPIWYQQYQDYDTVLTYKVKARDLSPNQNETDWSTAKNVTIPAPSPAGLLVDASFQTPSYNNGLDLNGGVFFVGWSWDAGGGDVHVRVAPNEGAPGDSTNRVIQFEQTSAEGIYDTDHPWASEEVYELTVNAAPMSWNGSIQRYLDPSIRQTDNTVLWSTNVPIPLYDAAFAGADPWPAELTFSFTINASEFSTGTEGENLRLWIDSSGQRGTLFDNVWLVYSVPQASGTVFRFW